MANSALINRNFVIPQSVVYYFHKNVPKVAVQVKNFLDRGYIGYYDMKNFIKDYPNLSDVEKAEHGGEIFFKWVNGLLERLRERVKQSKTNKAAMGQSNTFIKPHEKTPARHAHTQKPI